MAVQTFPSHRRGKIEQMSMFAYCYPHLPQKAKGYFSCETEGRRGGEGTESRSGKRHKKKSLE